MSEEHNFRGKRMREAMDHAGLTSGQVAYRMNVSDGAVRGWTTGRRDISPDDLAHFAELVGYPVAYFLYPDSHLPEDFSLRYELTKLARQLVRLSESIENRTPCGDPLEHLRNALNLDDATVEAISRIIAQAKEHT